MEINIFRKDMLISALLIVTVIFFLGFFLGNKLDTYKIDDATRLLNNGELDSESFTTIERFYYAFGVGKCDYNKEKISLLGKQLLEMGSTLTRYDQRKLTQKNNYINLKRKYFLAEIKFYTLKRELDNICSSKNKIILFFYNIKDNDQSLKQGYVLDILNKEYKDIIILSFDKDFDEDSIKTLNSFYNITKAPTIIYNYNKKIENFVNEKELRALINEDN